MLLEEQIKEAILRKDNKYNSIYKKTEKEARTSKIKSQIGEKVKTLHDWVGALSANFADGGGRVAIEVNLI